MADTFIMPRALPAGRPPARQPGAPPVGLDDTGPVQQDAVGAAHRAAAIGHMATARIVDLTDDDPPSRKPRPDSAAASRARRGDPLHLSPGMVIPGTRYRLIRWLGDGGMGVVYEAQHVDIERRVAIKVLRPEVCNHPQAMQLFRDEARAAARIGSSYIVEILDFAELPDGRLLYAMELLGGRPLSRELAGRPLPPGRALPILRQLCKGLASAHAAHVVHRDIKPDNIFLDDRQSRRDIVKILDFGLSVFMVEATATDADIVGTPMYLAPELVAGKPFDARVDMYAVGCTAHEMLTGRPPYTGTIRELLYAHVHAPVPSAETLQRDHDVPAELAEVIVRCLAKRPEDRYADMDDLEAALCEAQIAAGIETPWDDLPLPSVDVHRRDLLLRRMPDPTLVSAVLPRTRRSSIAAIVAACALALAGAVVLVRALTAPTAAVDPELARLEADARAAAARVVYVYPPADDPLATTAYQVIRELEATLGPHTRAAHDLAARLRREFAGTLGAFGDSLWERPGGLEFAVDAYAQALLFDPDLEPAAQRADLTPGQLARLATKAAARDFTSTELIAVEPLVVLAGETLPASPELAAARERIVRRVRHRGAAPTRANAPPAAPLAAASPTPSSPSTPPPNLAPAETKRPTRDPAAAARALDEADAAARDGRLAAAESAFERALAHDNHSVQALVGLTELYFNRGAYARALGFGARGLKLAPGDAALHLLVGDAAFKVFRFDDARAAYQRARELGHREAGQRLAKLDKKLAL
jgi:serine/threonine protein kinase/tetratricopeptide (TPR) repeat protein